MRFIRFILTMSIPLFLAVPQVLAQPAVSDITVTDVTPHAFSVAWVSDEASTGQLEVFSDPDGLNPLTVTLNNEGQNNPPAEDQGVFKIDVAGLSANTTYYFRTVTTSKGGSGIAVEPAVPPLIAVTTEDRVKRAVIVGADEAPFTNDQLALRVFQSDGVTPADGALVILDVQGAAHPVSAFVGKGSSSPTTLLDMNNLFDGTTHSSLDLTGGESGTLLLMGGLSGGGSSTMTIPVDAENSEILWATPSSLNMILDSDGDGVPDGADNCINIPNPGQCNTDGDAFGNVCDCDFNNDGFCGGPDFTLFIGCFNQAVGTNPICQAADMTCDGFVGGPDFTRFIGGFNAPPGP